jgi:flagellar hook protein FlgE
MLSSIYSSVSGLAAFSEQISVVGNNIANVETTSYKSNNITFADTLNEAISGASGETTGTGVEVQGVAESWTQGSFSTTSNSTDIAISGSGFFIVQEQDSGATYYSRDGGFEFDSDGTLINATGMAVQGYAIDEDGNLAALEDIVISYEPSPPNATSEMQTEVNLDSSSEPGETFSTATTVYDSLGNEISVTITYTKSANANEWDWEASISDTYGTLTGDSSGTLIFDENGALESGTEPEFTLELTNGADNTQTITWDVYEDDGTTNGSLTQYAGESALYDQSQDGYGSGELYDVTINEDGVIEGNYSNEDTRELYQIALADFSNYNGLQKMDDNLYSATTDSGQAVVGAPGTGQLGSVTAGSLETSNVDLATEMAKLITAQRAYQACSRVFSVTSEILETLVSLR